MYKNIPLLLLIIVNLALIIPFYFYTASLSFLDLQPIGQSYAAIVLGITIASCIVSWIINYIIDELKMHERLVSEIKIN
jgi:hypothetical protein